MSDDCRHHRRSPQGGYTLIELIVSMSAASMLMAGMLGSIFLVSHAFDGSDVQRETNQTVDVLSDIMADVRHATSFSDRTANAMTFKVPDRDGDLLPETIRYEWSGTPGDPLQYQYNSGPLTTIAANVQQFDLTSLTRFMAAPVVSSEGGGSLLFVFGGSGAPSAQEQLRIDLIESWGYTVTPISDTDSQANFDTAAAANDVIYVSGAISGGSLAHKLTGTTTGLVNEFPGKLDNFGFCSITTGTISTMGFSKSDAAHYISDPFSGGAISVFTTSLSIPVPGGTLAPGMVNVAELFGAPALVTLDTGAERYDSAPAPARRVHLPFASADMAQLTTDGQTIMQRSIEWAAGAGDGGGSSEGILGYDTQFASTTGGVNGWQIGTEVVMPENGTLTSITAYIDPGGGGKDYRFAIYTDNAGEPGNLIVETAVDGQSGTGWKTISVAPTPLTAGTYWLALSFSHGGQEYYHTDTGGNTRHKLHNAVGNGFIPVWPGATTPYTHQVSIYGTYTVTP